MAQHVNVVLTNDVDEGPDDEAVSLSIAVDGVVHEIDLTAAHVRRLRRFLAPFVGPARKDALAALIDQYREVQGLGKPAGEQTAVGHLWDNIRHRIAMGRLSREGAESVAALSRASRSPVHVEKLAIDEARAWVQDHPGSTPAEFLQGIGHPPTLAAFAAVARSFRALGVGQGRDGRVWWVADHPDVGAFIETDGWYPEGHPLGPTSWEFRVIWEGRVVEMSDALADIGRYAPSTLTVPDPAPESWFARELREERAHEFTCRRATWATDPTNPDPTEAKRAAFLLGEIDGMVGDTPQEPLIARLGIDTSAHPSLMSRLAEAYRGGVVSGSRDAARLAPRRGGP
jgi:hypothetical protein